jgi:hypothetical protein
MAANCGKPRRPSCCEFWTSSSGLPTFPKRRWKSAAACFAEAEPCWFPQVTAGGSNDRGRTHRGKPPTTSAIRRNHREDYAEYVRGSDIASFDIYPEAHDSPAVAGKLWFVPQGVGRLIQWAGPDRIVWNCIECTRIENSDHKATPRQVRCEVWIAAGFGPPKLGRN